MTEQKTYTCPNCDSITDTVVKKHIETYPVKGEKITLETDVRFCNKCGSSVYDKELDTATLKTVYAIYRQKHNLISPEELRAVREKYDLSQRSLGALLGWGEVTITRYENGSVPDEVHNSVLRLIHDPFNMQELFETNGHRLNKLAYKKLAHRIEELLIENRSEKLIEILSRVSKYKKPSEFTGYLKFNAEGLMDMMRFFAAKQDGVLKTKLNKLLWYSDFLHFREYTVSISGATYVHLPFGPVPDQYELFIGLLCERGDLNRTEEEFGAGIIGEKLTAIAESSTDVISKSALTILENVYQFFKDYNSKQISDMSHEESGYIETKLGEAISYQYADSLKVQLP